MDAIFTVLELSKMKEFCFGYGAVPALRIDFRATAEEWWMAKSNVVILMVMRRGLRDAGDGWQKGFGSGKLACKDLRACLSQVASASSALMPQASKMPRVSSKSAHQIWIGTSAGSDDDLNHHPTVTAPPNTVTMPSNRLTYVCAYPYPRKPQHEKAVCEDGKRIGLTI